MVKSQVVHTNHVSINRPSQLIQSKVVHTNHVSINRPSQLILALMPMPI